jgi:hypothetical protein
LACVERRVVDLVEQDGAAFGGHQLPVVALDRAGERAARVAEELGFHEVVWNRGAVDRHERLGVTRRPGMGERAITSLPVPVSPVKSTASTSARRARRARRAGRRRS